MTEATTDLRVTVAPGTGRVTRRAGSLLFDPSGDNTELIAGFDDADTDEAAIIAVKQHLIDGAFEASPVVVIDWRSDGLALLVFGDVNVQTSAAAAASINGAGSGTWIERHLGDLELGDAEQVDVWCGDETDDATDLRLGHVRAGGVRVALARAVEPVVEVAEVEPEVRRPVPEPEPESLNPRPVPSPVPAPAANGSAAPAADAPAVEAGFVAPGPAADWASAEPEPAAGAVAVAQDPFLEADHVPGDATDEAVTEGLAPTNDRAGAEPVAPGLVEAILCSNHHSNPPRYTICRVCAVEISPDTSVMLVAQPSVGHLRFDDGAVVEVDGALLIGRKPSPESASRPVTIDHAEVSRSHVEVTIDGWSVLVTDLGSRNGTWVIPTSDPTPIKLDPQVPYLLEHGTTVHLGGPEASFAYDFGTD